MDGREPSRTAWGAAQHRAAHQLLEGGAIFTDATSVTILGIPAKQIADDASARPQIRRMRLFIAARHRVADDVVADAVARGTRQVVVLGAGLDTTAYRLVAPPATVVFEVDHPATQQWKRERVAATGLVATVEVRHVGVDFEHDRLDDALAGAGFQASAPAAVLWLGVVPYLTTDAVEATLRTVATMPGSDLVFDYPEPVADRSAEERARHARRASRVAAAGEPWVTYFRPAMLRALLEGMGMTVVADEVAGSLVRHYLGMPPAAESRPGGHIVHAKVPVPPGR